MTINLPAWSIPLACTVIVWAWGILAPEQPSRGDYDFGPALHAIARVVLCVVGTLLFWLVYFAARSVLT